MNSYLYTKLIFRFIETHLASLYIDEQALTRDQVILPRDFLSFTLQKHIKQDTKSTDDTESEQEVIDLDKKLVNYFY